MKKAISILKKNMSVRYCGETRFDFLDPEEKVMIRRAMKEYAAECINALLNKCTTRHIGDEGEVRGMVLDVKKVDEFLFDNNLTK